MRRLLIIFLVVVSVVLLFWRLDGALLWRDEGSTANWGRLMAEKGSWLPYVVDDGQLIVQGADGHDFNSQLLPGMQSWLQFYVAAASFKVFGATTAAARLPFAILGGVCLLVLYRMGVLLFGTGLKPLLLPYLGILSIFFLFAARQSRYYILVVLATLLLLLEFFRYLRDPVIAASKSFYVRMGLYGILLYLANHVSFAAMWVSLGVFVLLMQDRQLLKGFALVSGILALVCGAEFAIFRMEFAANWPPPQSLPLWEVYRRAFLSHGFTIWQVVPLIFFVPAGIYLFQRTGAKLSPAMKFGVAITLALTVGPLFTNVAKMGVSDYGPGISLLVTVLFLVIPLTFFLFWRSIETPKLWPQAALLTGLILFISPLLTIAVGKQAASIRHYMQILPAALVLAALVTAGLWEQDRRWTPVLFIGILLWPNLCFNFRGNDQVVERQYLRDDSYNRPVINFLREHTHPGDAIAFYRNVQGMVGYFYLPEIRWVALLDSTEPDNQQFRGRLPDDQFDDHHGADWYVIWDPRDGWPKQMHDERYEKVWEYSYTRRRNWWRRHKEPARYTFQVYKRVLVRQ